MEEFCVHIKVGVSKTEIMIVKRQNKDKPCIMYNNEPLDTYEKRPPWSDLKS